MSYDREKLKGKLMLYLLCGEGFTPEQNIKIVQEALEGGVSSVQLRVKSWDAGTAYKCALQLKELCRAHDALLFVNDRVDIALAAGADGVHLGQKDLPISEARRIAGPGLIIGGTARTPEAALKAQEMGADYIGCGAAFDTETKGDAVVIGPHGIRETLGAVSVPSVAIGGINSGNITKLAGCMASGAALSGSIMHSADPRRAAADLLALCLDTFI